MAVELVAINGGNTEGVYFPIADKPENLEEMIRRKNFLRAPKAAVDELPRLEPYRGGNDAIRIIRDRYK